MSKKDINLEQIFGNLFNNENLQNTLKNFASQMSSYLINCDILNQYLDANPNITDELITKQINLYKKSHKNSVNIIDKYLESYQEERSNEYIYNIRKFVKSGDCKKALNDSQVQQYLNEVLNSSEFQQLISQFFSSK
jgi:DNA-binding phage protein